MSTQHHLAPVNHTDRDLCARERVLNFAIIAADISLERVLAANFLRWSSGLAHVFSKWGESWRAWK